MKYFFSIYFCLVFLQTHAQAKQDYQRSILDYVNFRHLYSHTDSTQFYCFKFFLDDKKQVSKITTYYFSRKTQIIFFSDTVSFQHFNYQDLSGKPVSMSNHRVYIQPFMLKKVNVDVNPPQNIDFSSADIESMFQLLKAANDVEKERVSILKPIIVHTEEYD